VAYDCAVTNVITGFTNVATVTANPLVGAGLTASDAAQVNVLAPAPTRHNLYLPVVTKPPVVIAVTTENTGGVRLLEILRAADNVRALVCTNIPDNVVAHPCGEVPPGAYKIKAQTSRCGALETQKTWTAGGPVTLRVYCQ
jgi:hypothetical protein